MSFLTVLYLLTLYPIEFLLQTIFSIISKVSGNTVLSIIILSIVVNTLVLPLYNRADKVQEEAKDKENKIAPMVKHIKQTFKGDERFMLLQTCYRQDNYSPLNVLSSSVSILLQIPFFLGAYNMLSHNRILEGVSLGPIASLSAPDGLLVIGGFAINVLPVLMTLINVASSFIYSKGFPLKTKIQMYGLALVFLVLLYQSPSGLVLYWICNNIYSLCKNVVRKIINSKKKNAEAKPAKAIKPLEPKFKAVFILSCVALALYTGFYIPMQTVASAPEEFVNLYSLSHPMLDILDSTAKSFGLFFIWPFIFYSIATVKGKRIMSYVMFSLTASAILNSKLFSNNFGFISNLLIYSNKPSFTVKNILISLLVTLGGVAICFLILRFGKYTPSVICFSVALVFCVLGFTNIGKVNKGYLEAKRSPTSKAEFTLSKNGKNVVVIMCDRAVGPMLPFIFSEKPELKKVYDGFVHYHNTASFGFHTNVASPALMGGYEYTPDAMNARTDKLLGEKHDEAVKLMPKIFIKEGYDATLINVPYVGYTWYPDFSVFDGMEKIKAYSTKDSYLPDDLRETYKTAYTDNLRYNLFSYSIFKSAPVGLQELLYDGGNYNDTKSVDPSKLSAQKSVSRFAAYGSRQEFMWCYYSTKALDQITKIDDSSDCHYVYFGTDITHDTQMLQEPAYEPADIVDNRQYEKTHQARFIRKGEVMSMRDENDYKHYQCNVAAYQLIGNWLEYLKENGVYDNTRIIIVSDHGWYLGNFTNLIQYEIGGKLDAESFAPLLLVKDFNAHGEIQTSEDFMTNADTPYIATKGIVSNPVNPFTGKPITDEPKKEGIKILGSGSNWDVRRNNGIAFEGGEWFTVHDSIWKKSNWKFLGKY
ncbi:MAG: YidC/Oxa1 family membrane protein insertase [Saccharofermentans sp.]|nr:YidC/Oxa1 family membrane protein insertase [Saccharofermentans sp.]